MGGWVGGWVGGTYRCVSVRLPMSRESLPAGASRTVLRSSRSWIWQEDWGGWVGEGGWVGWIEETEAVGMSYCELGVGLVDGGGKGGLNGWVGGWVGGWDVLP